MKQLKVIIGEESAALTKEVLGFFEGDSQVSVVGSANNGMSLISLYEGSRPDVVVLDLVLPEIDGFGVIEKIKMDITNDPLIIVVSKIISDVYINKVLDKGANYFMAKPYNLENLKARICDKFLEVEKSQKSNFEIRNPVITLRKRNSLDERLANIFISVGIPAHVKGYQFLREAIKLAVDSPEIINSITKKLYPSIATRFETTPSKVERAIRHAIEVAWSRGKIENINHIFGLKVYGSNDKPTNGEFIALVADKMLIEGA